MDKIVTLISPRAQGMAIGRIDNADADVDMNNPDGAEDRLWPGCCRFGAFGKGTVVILKLFNAAALSSPAWFQVRASPAT